MDAFRALIACFHLARDIKAPRSYFHEVHNSMMRTVSELSYAASTEWFHCCAELFQSSGLLFPSCECFQSLSKLIPPRKCFQSSDKLIPSCECFQCIRYMLLPSCERTEYKGTALHSSAKLLQISGILFYSKKVITLYCIPFECVLILDKHWNVINWSKREKKKKDLRQFGSEWQNVGDQNVSISGS